MKGLENGKLLWINLTNNSITEKIIPVNEQKKFLGGRGLCSYYLYKFLDKKATAFSPENLLIFMTGLLTGMRFPSSGRYDVISKTPYNYFGNSNSGGYWAAELKFAGIDGLIFEGHSEKPVYMSIIGEDIQLHDADHLWGMDTYQTEDMIKSDLNEKKVKIACIGPAGENLVNFSCIMNDLGRAAGRCGFGAVMGSKNLKAISVHRGGEKR